MMPSLFIVHGAPDLTVHDRPSRRFLPTYAAELPPPAAICVISAHCASAQTRVTAAPQPRTVHDFGGVDPALSQLAYPAPGDPALAQCTVAACAQAGIPAVTYVQGGFDHACGVR